MAHVLICGERSASELAAVIYETHEVDRYLEDVDRLARLVRYRDPLGGCDRCSPDRCRLRARDTARDGSHDRRSDEVESSASDLRIRSRNGMIAQPTSSGIRHPHASIWARVSEYVRITPNDAANTTAICWLAFCQLT